ncbi:MAG: endopeptidase La [Deltaproteobacteria bacterium]|nr:endopeptidase La [Deltaproteobacteria bacterium]
MTGQKEEIKVEEIRDEGIKWPEEWPVIPVEDTVLFPQMVIPLTISDKKLVKLVDDALSGERLAAVFTTKSDPKGELYDVGTSAQILRMMKVQEDQVRLLVQGVARMRNTGITSTEPYMKARLERLYDKVAKDKEAEALVYNLRNLFQKVLELSPNIPSELGTIALNIEDPGTLSDMIASSLNISISERQDILETLEVKARLEKVMRLVTRQTEIMELGRKIHTQVKGEIDKTQREYYLREQLKAIKKELGEKDELSIEIDELRAKVEEKKLPEVVNKEAMRELGRLARMHPSSAEYTVARTYLDWILDLPWHEHTEDNLDIVAAQKILDEDHYDLEKVKKRIIEYLAVRKLKADMKGPILCFVGPPGTGKTSLGRSVARALGRKFMRISLGGVRDEAEIRGHRRTYIGALPGRIIQGIRRAGSNNPVFVLDEIDKIGADFRGDPAAALLEVLDPEQNNTFSDHYLDVPFDLSKVMFITTANLLDTVPPALLDRMEVLELPGYTDEEKVRIAQKYLIPRQLTEHGLKSKQIRFEKKAIQKILSEYTREAGLRNLEREVAAICRGIAKRVATGEMEKFVVSAEAVPEFLGPPQFYPEVADRTAVAGVATGLAWTQAGGEILFIEATKMKGNGRLLLTGKLGEVMKESAETALSFVRSKAKSLGIDEGLFEKNDIHIHVPAGAIPKDGPSAGVAIFTALVSLLTDKPVNSQAAMTGEITLRGRILPVGGIKSKVLAASRAGIKTIILPKRNEKDMEEIPDDVKKGLDFKFLTRMEEVIPIAFAGKGSSRRKGRHA